MQLAIPSNQLPIQKEQVAAGVIVPVRVDTSENKSDLLTKALGPQVFPGFAQSLVGLVAPSTTQRVLMLRVVAGDEDRENAPPPASALAERPTSWPSQR